MTSPAPNSPDRLARLERFKIVGVTSDQRGIVRCAACSVDLPHPAHLLDAVAAAADHACVPKLSRAWEISNEAEKMMAQARALRDEAEAEALDDPDPEPEVVEVRVVEP